MILSIFKQPESSVNPDFIFKANKYQVLKDSAKTYPYKIHNSNIILLGKVSYVGDGLLSVYDRETKKRVGLLDFNIFTKETRIAFMLVREAYRGKGVAVTMHQMLMDLTGKPIVSDTVMSEAGRAVWVKLSKIGSVDLLSGNLKKVIKKNIKLTGTDDSRVFNDNPDVLEENVLRLNTINQNQATMLKGI